MNIEKKKSNRGGKRPGAGRKPMKVEDNVRLAIQQALSEDPEQVRRIWKKILEKAEKGSDRHALIFLQYYHGKPVETVNVTSKQLKITRRIIHE